MKKKEEKIKEVEEKLVEKSYKGEIAAQRKIDWVKEKKQKEKMLKDQLLKLN